MPTSAPASGWWWDATGNGGLGSIKHVSGATTTLVSASITSTITPSPVTYNVVITGTGGTATCTYTHGGVTGTPLAASGTIAIADYITVTTAITNTALVITPGNTSTVEITSITVKALTDATGDATIDGNLKVRSPGTFYGGITLSGTTDIALQTYRLTDLYTYAEVRRDANEGTVLTVRNATNGTKVNSWIETQVNNGSNWFGGGLASYPDAFDGTTLGTHLVGNSAIMTFGSPTAGLGNLLFAQRNTNAANYIGFYIGSALIDATSLAMKINQSKQVAIGPIGAMTIADTLHVKADAIGKGFRVEDFTDDSVFRTYRHSDLNWKFSATYASTGSYGGIVFRTSDVDRIRIATNGDVSIGTNVAYDKFHLLGGNASVQNTATLGSESLNETDFATHLKWTETGGFAFSTNKYVYTDDGGSHAGTLTQTAANRVIAGIGSRGYVFQYDVSNSNVTTALLAATITTGFAASAVSLDLTNGTNKTVSFKAAAGAATGDFVISVTSSTNGTFTLDNVSLKEIQGGDVLIGGYLQMGNSSTTVTNDYVVAGGQAATTHNTGWLPIYVNGVLSWIPFWSNATP